MTLTEMMRGRDVRALLLIAAAVVLVYFNALNAPLVFDDYSTITENESIQHVSTALLPPTDSGAPVSGRPVLNFTFFLNHLLGLTSAWGYRSVNVVLHVAAAVILYGVVLEMAAVLRRNTPPWLPLAVASLWALHPLQTESVTYISQRAELVVSLFFLLTIYCFLRATRAEASGRWRIACVVSCALGMGSKEVMVSAPLIIYLLDAVVVSRSWTAPFRQRGRLFLLLAATWLILVACMRSTGARGGTVGQGPVITTGLYFLTQCEAIVMYLRLALWPHPLVFDYGTYVVEGFHQVFAQFLILSVLFGAAVYALVQKRCIGWLGAAFFAVLAPSSSFVPVLTQTMAEHRTYLVLAIVVVLFVLALYKWLARWAPWVCVAAALALGLTTWQRNLDYATPEKLWTDTAAKRPQNHRAWNSLGACLLQRNDIPAAKRAVQRAIAIAPGDLAPVLNYALLLAAAKEYPEAETYFRKALEIESRWFLTRHGYGKMLLDSGEPQRARDHLKVAIELEPKSAEARHSLGLSYVATREYAPASDLFQKAIELKPGLAVARNDLALAELKMGKLDAAMYVVDEARRLYPRLASFNRTRALILIQESRADEAVAILRPMVALDPANPSLLCDLGLALATAGEAREAIETYAAALAAGYGETTPGLRRAVHVSMGELWLQLAQPENAAGAFGKAVELEPDSAEIRVSLAGALLMAGAVPEAAVEYEKAIKDAVTASNPDVLNNLGVAYMRMGEVGRARQSFTAALRENPSHRDAQENLQALSGAVR